MYRSWLAYRCHDRRTHVDDHRNQRGVDRACGPHPQPVQYAQGPVIELAVRRECSLRRELRVWKVTASGLGSGGRAVRRKRVAKLPAQGKQLVRKSAGGQWYGITRRSAFLIPC